MRKNVRGVAGLLGFALLVLAPPAALAQTTTRVSVASAGAQGNSHSESASISSSADGRFVAFTSACTNLAPGDTNGFRDVFMHDRQAGTTTRVSVASEGAQGDNLSDRASISASGRFVAFRSLATTLVPGDVNGQRDIFVHDRQTGATTLVSVSSAGVQANSQCHDPSISADGRFVAFWSVASNLVAGDTVGFFEDIFVHDRQTALTTRVSVSSTGAPANSDCESPSISADGRFVAFETRASNLITPGDFDGIFDIFVHDRQTGATTRESVSSLGVGGNADSFDPSISADGRFVAFVSVASNLVPGDTNFAGDTFVRDRQTGTTTRVSVSSAGAQGNGASQLFPSISAEGRFVAFHSAATNLVAMDANGRVDIFVHDRQTGATAIASVSTSGTQGNDGIQTSPSISAGGRFVAFESFANNLVPGDTNFSSDIFVRDRGACTGDANGDGAVDFTDLNIVLSDFGLVGPGLAGDLDGDGDCDFMDLNVVLGFFGVTC